MKILDLSLTYHWYDMIASGEKKEEYREMKEFYFKRLNMEWRLHLEQGCYKGCDEFSYNPSHCVGCKKFKPYPYDAVRFHRGQGGKTKMLVECNGIHIGQGKPEWGAVPGETYFVIELGKIIEENGSKN
jgi:hypothetical protein